ncbi:hypothetical protein BCV70DRAFT_5497 [Testicularia cyperi]|uniref:M-phase inducer phosphatase n=1 Tax=Testicularia cyperi TaxID=1882483 RepID=A0A317XYA9_9BASI|nr:hypothetical protein BCV70DRAFT_5497 [Testicularia cyperi]
MTTLMSSPMGPHARFDLFEQPSSPKYYPVDDLPADFDKSFGSSMSISDSDDGLALHAQAFPILGVSTHVNLFNSAFGAPRALGQPQLNKPAAGAKNENLLRPNAASTSRISPRRGHMLGAAMGTTFNSRSPGLGARMSSPQDMDISPAPVASGSSRRSPSETLPKLMDSIHVGPTSPSPSRAGGMAAYFFDPMSPEKGAAQSRTSAAAAVSAGAPNLLAAMSTSGQSSSNTTSSPPGSSPCTRMPPPRRTTSLGPRMFERTHTTTAAVSRAGSGTGPTTLRSSLGKRANPYAKRPSLSGQGQTAKSAYPVLGVSGQTNKVFRPNPPAPRRCFSAMDHSQALGTASIASTSQPPRLPAVPVSPERPRSLTRGYSEMADANGSPIAPGLRSRPNFLRRASKDDSSPLAYGTGMKRSGSRGDSIVDDLGVNDNAFGSSPASAESLPGFGASEKEGKILPCFNVKDDGLMRIAPQTLTDLLAGKFTNAIASYQVVDCRFGYEFDGGHIPGAINLSTVGKVISHFLVAGQGRHEGQPLPPRSQSGKADKTGNRRKHVLVFHCEFSCKRAPSMALALRQADRALAHDYPNCHFPELYVLQGGYCDFFRTYANLCEPQQYVCMDDPRYHDKRSTELNGFRKQFSRHRSFTYGEGKRQQSLPSTAVVMSRKPSDHSIKEEDDSSQIEESPCPAGAIKRVLTNSRPVTLDEDEMIETVHDLLSTVDDGAAAADTSFGSVGDSSFEGGIGDSPCAAAGFRKPTASLMVLQPRIGSLGRRPLLRAGTTGNILDR